MAALGSGSSAESVLAGCGARVRHISMPEVRPVHEVPGHLGTCVPPVLDVGLCDMLDHFPPCTRRGR